MSDYDKRPLRWAPMETDEVACAHPQRPGFAYFTIRHRVRNPVWQSSAIRDGIAISIYQFRNKDYQLDCHASRPDWSRKQMNKVVNLSSYEEAKRLAWEWYEKALAFCNATVDKDNCAMPHVIGATLWPRDNRCRECGWEEAPRPRRRAGGGQ